ncbi:tannase/feruloyl esterase family alpha/beta hydrolase [Ralstonia sp. A12]|uniref:tannase/feruloyl esterase family alpha/beta hydrolase n=1 Tax=Ralstonia sp. A12 TaxID=1217052 RepID=UPI001E5DCDE5|nr:tannase/feruloyl esterase family alpha/beta hydrolase [Ralstonia sp. A12]
MAMQNMTFGDATITKATFAPATSKEPERCVALAHMAKELDFEVSMPTDWNHRTVFIGGGGFDGSVSDMLDFTVSPGLRQHGYVTIKSNHGHNSSPMDASWALDDQEFADYATDSVPRVLTPAKQILQSYYGDRASTAKTVFEGCSGGGRRALMQAQRYPQLFDGIIARAPANAFNPQFLWYQKVAKQLAQPGGALSAAKVKAVANAVYAKCDALDGLADGIVGRPNACNFDPIELACTGAETDSCLTPQQVESARTFYAPTNIANGRYVWAGFSPGGEDGSTGWAAVINQQSLMAGYIKYMVARDATIDPLQLDPTQYTARIDQLVSMLDATSPDLSAFKARGGKLMMWAGQADWLITANNATDYYQQVVQKSGGQAAADEFLEYYTAPGVGHCGQGNGADKVDLVGPMFDWVEKDIPPRTSPIIAMSTMAPNKSRPVCRYPQYPKYIGGDPNAASSFACTSP